MTQISFWGELLDEDVGLDFASGGKLMDWADETVAGVTENRSCCDA